MWAADRVDHATGAARRRRRLRAHLRYARMSVAMFLAECQHHTAPEEGKGPGGGTGGAPQGRVPEDCSLAGCGPTCCWSRTAARASPAAHRGTHRRRLALRADPRRTGAADGGPTGGFHEDARHCDP